MLFFACSAVAQSPMAAMGREPLRGRLVPTAKRDTVDSYRREVTWQQQDECARIYRAEVPTPFAWNNRQVLVRIAGAPAGYELWVNGRLMGCVTTGALPAEFNVTRGVNVGAANHFELRLHSEESAISKLEDFDHPTQVLLTELISQPTIRVRDVRVTTRRIEADYLAEVAVAVKCDALNEKSARIRYELTDPAGKVVKQGFEDLSLRMRGEDTLRFVCSPEHLWSTDHPALYRLRLSTQTEGRYTEYLNLPVGFRHVELADRTLLLNGRPLKVHPYVVEKMMTAEDLDLLKTQGYSLLLPLPGCSTEELYTLADQKGLCVVAQSPICTQNSGESRVKGGNPSNDPQMVEEYLDRTASTRHLAQRHPSVVGCAIAHKSANGIALYESYLALKRVEEQLPIFYFDAAGEWNHDPLNVDK